MMGGASPPNIYHLPLPLALPLALPLSMSLALPLSMPLVGMVHGKKNFFNIDSAKLRLWI